MGSEEVDTNQTACGVYRLQNVEADWFNTLGVDSKRKPPVIYNGKIGDFFFRVALYFQITKTCIRD